MTEGRTADGESVALAPGAPPVPDPWLQPDPSAAESAMMDRFRHEYLDLLDDRLAAIRACVAEDRLEDAQVAVLSLESTSGMLGEEAMVQRLHDFRSALEVLPTTRREAMIAVIEAEATRVRRRHES